MVKVRIADQLRTVIALTVQIGIDVAIRNSEWASAAYPDDGREAPAVNDGFEHAIVAVVEVGLEVSAKTENMTLVCIGTSLFELEARVVLGKTLRRVVV
jgi:hypothetical protein